MVGDELCGSRGARGLRQLSGVAERWLAIVLPMVDVEVAWEARAEAQRAVESAEVAAAVERLLEERPTVGDVVKLTGLDQPTVRRLRKAKAGIEEAPPCPSPQGQRTEG
jgi:hypothetical protein